MKYTYIVLLKHDSKLHLNIHSKYIYIYVEGRKVDFVNAEHTSLLTCNANCNTLINQPADNRRSGSF